MESQITLKELNLLIKDTLQLSFPESLWVVAEIGELKTNQAGHCYIELVQKEDQADTIVARSRATIWSWQFRFIKPYFESTTGQTLAAGIKVLIAVSVEFHEVYGISLNIKDIDPTYTLGDMARKRQEIIKRLTDEGVIAMNSEIPLADIPSRIAIISSPTAAGYEDFINQLQNNSSGYQFYTKLFPAMMQGNDAAKSMINALDHIFEHEELFDVVVIIRGGGSQMDLNCFNDYDLAYHVAQFPLPVLTGIGHEKDESITDMVAHTKLKTPTAVAEFLIEKMDLAADKIDELENAFFDAVTTILETEKNRIEQTIKLFKPLIKSKLERTLLQLAHLAKGVKPIVNDVIDRQQFRLIQLSAGLKSETLALLKKQHHYIEHHKATVSFTVKLKNNRENQYIDEKTELLSRMVHQKIIKEFNRVEWLEKNKQLIDPKNILKRGFSITLKNRKAVKNANELSQGDTIENILYNGKVVSEVKI